LQEDQITQLEVTVKRELPASQRMNDSLGWRTRPMAAEDQVAKTHDHLLRDDAIYWLMRWHTCEHENRRWTASGTNDYLTANTSMKFIFGSWYGEHIML
jgi:hypothetical protein